MLAALLSNPAVVALIAGIPSLLMAWFGYHRAAILDKRAEVSGAASFQLGAVGQVIDGLNALVDSLQKDNEALRRSATQLAGDRVAAAMERLAFSAEALADRPKDTPPEQPAH